MVAEFSSVKVNGTKIAVRIEPCFSLCDLGNGGIGGIGEGGAVLGRG